MENLADTLKDLENEEENVMQEKQDSEKPYQPRSSVWTEYGGRIKSFTFTVPKGLQMNISASITPIEIFSILVDDKIINHIVAETNRFADQTIATMVQRKYAWLNKGKPTNDEETKKFFGLVLWMGLVRLGSLIFEMLIERKKNLGTSNMFSNDLYHWDAMYEGI